MPLVPNFFERLVLFRLNRGPAPILDLFGAASFETLTLAVEMGLFEALLDRPLSAGELAARLDADETGLGALLDFLAAQGYVAVDGEQYQNTAMTETWLTSAAGTNMAPWLTFWDELVFPYWEATLEETVRTGGGDRTIYDWFDEEPERWNLAQAGFRAAASVTVEETTRAVRVPDGATRLLDVGGGHGLYAVELCRARPSLSAVVFDNPLALDLAREEIAAAGLTDRVGVAGGDYRTDDLGEGFDVALVFNVVHAHDGPANRRLFERVADALAPGGRIAVLDQFDGSATTPVGRAALGFVGLTYLTTLGATLHSYESVARWLGDAGFVDVDRTSIRRAGPGNTLVQATKPVA